MKHKILSINTTVDIPEGSYTALKAMSFLRSSRASLAYIPKMDDICQYHNKVGAVVAVNDQHALLAIISCEAGKWSSANDVLVVRADELTRLDEDQISNTLEIGASALFKSLGATTVEYPEHVEEDADASQSKWW